MTRLGETIKSYREGKGWNQKQLSESAGVSPATVSGVENGRFVPSPEVVHRFALALGIKFHKLAELLLPAKVDTMLEIGRMYASDHELHHALHIVHRLQTEHCDLLEYQQNEVIRLEAHALCFWTESRMQSIETLYALSQKAEGTYHSDPLFIFRVQNSLGIAWHKNYDFITALHHFRRAYEILSLLPEPQEELNARILYNMAECVRYMGHDDEAIAYLQQALPLHRHYRNAFAVGACYILMGGCYKNLGRMQEATDACRESIHWFEQAQHVHAKWFATRARSYSYVWDPKLSLEAISVLEEELRVLRDLMPPKDIALTTTRIAKVYLDLNRFAEAEVAFEKAKALSLSLHPCGERAYFLLTYAKYHFAIGDFDAASTFAFESADLYASLRFFHSDMHEALYLGQAAVFRMREEVTQS